MKTLPLYSIPQIQGWDEFTIKNEPILSIDLMERAAQAFVDWFANMCAKDESIGIYCGPGNNGGDGFAIGRLLIDLGYKVEIFSFGNDRSEDAQVNYDRLKVAPQQIETIDNANSNYDVLIDAIFGSGLTRPIEGLYAEVINALNTKESKRISVDIPSGMFGDKINNNGAVFRADLVGTFQVPKRSMLFPENAENCKQFDVLDIGLSGSYGEMCTWHYLIGSELNEPVKFSHKGSHGKTLIISGSQGKMGACILASKATLRSGAGLAVAHIPSHGNRILQSSVPEVMTDCDKNEEFITELPDISMFNSIGIGPGIGTDAKTAEVVSELLDNTNVPVIIDADALNCISMYNLQDKLHGNCVLTPHPKEFDRLFGSTENTPMAIDLQREKSIKYGCVIVRKGAHTTITSSKGEVYFNSTGNPGMGTAGSGDVLTGVISGLLAQGMSPLDAALEGVFEHGVAGDKAMKCRGLRNMVAGDIVDQLFRAQKKSRS